MIRVIGVLLFLACSTPRMPGSTLLAAKPKECVSLCGMLTEFKSAEDCADFRMTESRTLAKYDKEVKWFSYTAGCTALQGWRVTRHDPANIDPVCLPGWREAGVCVLGWTHPDRREMDVLPYGSFGRSSLPHEMGHVMLGLGHCGWKARGVLKAITEVSGESESSIDYCD